jgi:protein O-GlcNAc transferase
VSNPRLEEARALHRAGRLEEAARLVGDVLHANARDGEALQLLALVQIDRGRFDAAARLLDETTKHVGESATMLFAQGRVAQGLNRHVEALGLFDRALAADPELAEAQLCRANAFLALGRFPNAIAAYDAYLAHDPDSAEAWHNRAVSLCKTDRFAESLPSFDRAVGLSPGVAAGWRNRGTALLQLKRFEAAIGDLEEALRLDPALAYARGYLMLARLGCCDWRGLEQARARITADVRAGRPAIPPFANLFISRDVVDQAHCAALWLKETVSPRAPSWRGERYDHDKIRVAYVSGDLREHPVGLLLAGVLDQHDHGAFEVSAYSFGPDDGSALRARIAAATDFVDVRRLSDLEIAQRLRTDETDIVVDLMGLTEGCRCGIFAFRPAPAQVSFLGYPATQAAPWMDYVLADRTVIPEADARFYRECIAWLPHCYMPADDARPIGPVPGRAEAGLPERGPVFAAFNKTERVQPEMFGVWMRILSAVEGSVLWLADGGPEMRRNLAREAQARGVHSARLLFAPYVAANADHLARLSLADLFLDTLPCNAHSAASDALWAGVPVLTCPGVTFAGRVAASLVGAAGIPQLIMESLEAYEAAAVRLGSEPAGLAGLKAELRSERRSAPLFDTLSYTRDLERAFTAIVARARAGAARHSFALEPA